MKRMTRREIAAAFTASVNATDKSYLRSLRQLSEALGDLQAAGMDVALDMFGECTEMGFCLDPGSKDWTALTSGLLRIGNSHHLVTYVSDIKREGAHEQSKCSLLLVSDLDIRFQGSDKEIRTIVYDFNDKDMMVDLQQNIIYILAHQKAIADADIRSAFNTTSRPSMNLALRKGQVFQARKAPQVQKK